MTISKEEWQQMSDDELHGYVRGPNPWTMSYRIERLLKMQEKTPLVINTMPRNKNLRWAKNRIFVLSFPGWKVEQVPLDSTPRPHWQMALGQPGQPKAPELKKGDWIHLRSTHGREKLAISLLVGSQHQGIGNVTIIRRQGIGMLNRLIEVSSDQTIFILPDEKSFTVKMSTMQQLLEAGLRIPSSQTARPIPLIK